MGSNGLTSARHDVFCKDYATKYPDSYDHNTPAEVIYMGSKKLTDPTPISGMDAGKLVLSVIKDNLLDIPPLFKMIKEESGLDYREMYQVFNMGHRLEVYTPDEAAAYDMVDLAQAYGIDAQIIGRVEQSSSPSLVISNSEGSWEY